MLQKAAEGWDVAFPREYTSLKWSSAHVGGGGSSWSTRRSSSQWPERGAAPTAKRPPNESGEVCSYACGGYGSGSGGGGCGDVYRRRGGLRRAGAGAGLGDLDRRRRADDVWLDTNRHAVDLRVSSIDLGLGDIERLDGGRDFPGAGDRLPRTLGGVGADRRNRWGRHGGDRRRGGQGPPNRRAHGPYTAHSAGHRGSGHGR